LSAAFFLDNARRWEIAFCVKRNAHLVHEHLFSRSHR
jgi:hypothetical protein